MNKGHLSVGRSLLALNITIRKECLNEYLMSDRAGRKYWGEPNMPLYGPIGRFSRWLQAKKHK
jgi:hypothetical protein